MERVGGRGTNNPRCAQSSNENNDFGILLFILCHFSGHPKSRKQFKITLVIPSEFVVRCGTYSIIIFNICEDPPV